MMDICNYLCDEDISNILSKYNSKKRLHHLQKVACYSDALIRLLWDISEFNESDRTMLKYSCMLHDIGYFINSRDHHSHSKYIILNDELFDKLPSSERNILAVVVSSHRKKLDSEVNYYSRREQRKIIELISILRLADALDYGEDYILENAYVDGDILYFKTLQYPSSKAFKKLSKKSELFESIFNLNIKLCN